jgi:hypothetical protein
VHLIIHNGGFLSVDGVLKARAMELLDLLLRADSSMDDWLSMLQVKKINALF